MKLYKLYDMNYPLLYDLTLLGISSKIYEFQANIAQSVERNIGNVEVTGSIPVISF